MQTYKYILFDLDGTITDPKVGITKSVAYALKHFGIIVNDLDTLCKFIGPPLTDTFAEFYGFGKDECDIAIKKFREYFSDKGIYENEVYPGMPTLLKELNNNGMKLILATSKPTIYAKQILEYFNLHQFFAFIAGSEINLGRYNKGEVIKYAIDENEIINRSEVIMIGDRKHDIIGAKENGISSVGVLYGYGSKEELIEAGADHVVRTVVELGELLTKLPHHF